MPPNTKFARERFGLAVRRRREQLRWSQEEFAEHAGIHRTYVSSIELGKVSIGLEIATALAEALDVRLSALLREAE